MSDNFFRINKGIKLIPTSEPAGAQEGNIYVDQGDDKVVIVGATKFIDTTQANIVEINPIPVTEISGAEYTTIQTNVDGFYFKPDPASTTGSHKFFINNEPRLNVLDTAVEVIGPTAGGVTSLNIVYNNGANTVEITPDVSGSPLALTEIKLPTTVASDTLVSRTSSDTLENKTINTTTNTIQVNGTSLTAVTGTGSVVLANSPVLTTPNIGAAIATSIESSSLLTVKTNDMTGTSGGIDITTGDSTTAVSGSIQLVTGDTDSANSGDINLSTGISNSGFRGNIYVEGYQIDLSSDNINLGFYDVGSSLYPLSINTAGSVNLTSNFGDFTATSANNIQFTSNVDTSIIATTGNVEIFSNTGNMYIKGNQVNIGPTVGPFYDYALTVSHSSASTTFDSATDSFTFNGLFLIYAPGSPFASLAVDSWAFELGSNPSGGSKEFQFNTNSNSNYLRLKADDAAVANYTLTFPGAAPTAYTVLGYNGTNYSWTNTFETINGASTQDLTIVPNSTQDLYLNLTGTSKLIVGDTTGLNYISIDTNNPTIQTITSPSNFKIESNNAGAAGVITIDAQEVVYKENNVTYVSVNSGGIEMLENLDASSKYLLFAANSNVIMMKVNSTLATSYDFILPDNAPTTDYALTYNGTNLDWYNSNAAVSSNTSLAASGTITIDTTTKSTHQVITVASAGGNVTLSTTPFGSTAPLKDGTIIRLIGTNDLNTITITSSDIAKGAVLNGNATLGKFNSLTLQYISSLDRYIEVSRNF
jgi:hypothetical protein